MCRALSEHFNILSNFPELSSLEDSVVENEDEDGSRMEEQYIKNKLIQNVTNVIVAKEKTKTIPDLIATDPELLKEQINKRHKTR